MNKVQSQYIQDEDERLLREKELVSQRRGEILPLPAKRKVRKARSISNVTIMSPLGRANGARGYRSAASDGELKRMIFLHNCYISG